MTLLRGVSKEVNIYWNTLNRRYPPSRFAIFPYNYSQILIPKLHYEPQIHAFATPQTTKFHVFIIIFPFKIMENSSRYPTFLYQPRFQQRNRVG
jgi:hypothetical protein